jgi:hypothetical protein
MWVKARVAILAAMGIFFVGCESIPQHEIPDLYPASGPVGLRAGFTFQNNFPTDELPYWDAGRWWERGYGGAGEVMIDASPYWGGFFGIGYEQYPGGEVAFQPKTGPGSTVKVDALNLVPVYIGLVGRIPYWLDEKKWAEEVDPVWLTNDPVGFAPYFKGSVGGAILTKSPDMAGEDGSPLEGSVDRLLDYQIFPFMEGSVGLEYRERSVGYWAEVGYRYYIIPDRENGSFGDDRMGRLSGIRAMVGITWYLW